MNPDEQALVDLANEEANVPAQEQPEPEATETKETETPKEEPKTPEEQPKEEAPAESKETPEPLQAEDSEFDWESLLPNPSTPPPPPPQVNEDGAYDPEQFTRSVVEQAKYELRQELNFREAEIRQLKQAEKILPEIKSNEKIRELVMNQRIADAVAGKQGGILEAAQTIKDLMGEAKAKGQTDAKSSVTIQTAAAIEKGATARPVEDNSGRLDQRLAANDPSAYEELMADWLEQGKI